MNHLVKITALAVCLATSAFAVDRTYIGGGTWKDTKGQSGTWKRQIVMKEVDKKTQMSDSLQVLVKGKEIFQEVKESTLVPTQTDMFDIEVDGKKSGWGYCFQVHCHFQGQKDDGNWEETLIGKDFMTVQGSEVKPGETIIWRGKMRRK